MPCRRGRHHRRRRPSSAATATLLENEDLLTEILHRLPPQPSSLPRVSLVCKQWRRIVSDPHFCSRLLAHHRTAPLLGFFHDNNGNFLQICFTAALDSPDCIPSERFSLQIDSLSNYDFLCCRHGRVLLANQMLLDCLVWDPITGNQHHVPFPPSFHGVDKNYAVNGAIICSAVGKGHIHGACHSSPFRLVLLAHTPEKFLACAYSSQTDTWGHLISISRQLEDMPILSYDAPNVLVGNSFFWMLDGVKLSILEFDLDRQSVDIIEFPFALDANYRNNWHAAITPVDGEIGLLILSGFDTQLWKRSTNPDGVAEWVLAKTIKLSKRRLSVRSGMSRLLPGLVGLAEADNAMVLKTGDDDIFMVNLESEQLKKLQGVKMRCSWCYPFTSFYTAGF